MYLMSVRKPQRVSGPLQTRKPPSTFNNMGCKRSLARVKEEEKVVAGLTLCLDVGRKDATHSSGRKTRSKADVVWLVWDAREWWSFKRKNNTQQGGGVVMCESVRLPPVTSSLTSVSHSGHDHLFAPLITWDCKGEAGASSNETTQTFLPWRVILGFFLLFLLSHIC